MKKLYLAMALAALFLGAPSPCLAADEPEYEGRPLSYWLRDLGQSGSRSVESLRKSQAAVRAIGTNALPVLMERMSATNLIARPGDALAVRYGFQALGSLAKPAIPQLIGLLRPALYAARHSGEEANRSNRVTGAAAAALHAIGPDAFPPLTNALASGDEELRFGLLTAIASFSRSKPAEVQTTLLTALRDPSPSVRWMGARSLGDSRAEPAAVVPALMEAARDTDSTVRWYAFQALGKYGPQARAAVPLLLQAARGHSIGHGGPVEALRKIDPANAVDAFTVDLANEDKAIRGTALRALREFGPAARRAAPALLRTMESSDHEERALAGFALKGVGPESLPGLINLLRHTNADVRFGAVRTISMFDTNAHSAAAELATLRDDPDQTVRRAAESVVKKLSESAEKANAPFKSDIVRRPVRVPADDRKEQPPPVEQLEKQITAAIAKLRNPDVRVEGFCELIEMHYAGTGSRTPTDDFAVTKMLREADTALHACPDLAGIVSSLESRLKKPETRMEALKALLKFGRSYLYLGSVGFGGSGDARYDEAQRQAASAVTDCHDVETVGNALESADETLRHWAVMSFSPDRISKTDWDRLAPKFKKIVAEDTSGLRALAGERLRWFAGTREFLEERLQAEASPNVLMRLLQARYGRVSDEYFREFLVLFRPLLDHENERVRHDALVFIADHSNPSRAPMWQFPFGRDVSDRVLELTRSPSAQDRLDATQSLRGLKQINPEQRREALLRLIRDTNAEVRRSAGWGLAVEKERPEVAQALRGLLAEPSPSIRYSAILMLGATNYVRELQELARGLDERVAEDARHHLEWMAKQQRATNAPAQRK